MAVPRFCRNNASHPTPLGRRRVMRALVTSAGSCSGGAAGAGSIRDTVQATLDSNPEIGVVKSNRHAVDQELRQPRAGYYPVARCARGDRSRIYRSAATEPRAADGDDDADRCCARRRSSR